MASAQVVITDANEGTPAVGGIFDGLSFFLLQRLPMRSQFVSDVKVNGGRVVMQEAQADHIIADHLRKDAPAGSISYTFIQNALKTGVLPDPKDHQAGPQQGTIRTTGSAIPSKGTRTPFTPQEDRELWQFVQRLVAEGYREKGNELYMKLEAINPRHTFQSWRDRYIKKLIDHPPAGVEVTVAANAPPTPPTAQDAQPEIATEVEATEEDEVEQDAEPDVEAEEEEEEVVEEVEVEDEEVEEDEPDFTEEEGEEEDEPDFTKEDYNELFKNAGDIEEIDDELEQAAWKQWHESNPQHSAASWSNFYYTRVRPAYRRQLRAEMKKARKEKREVLVRSVTPDDVNAGDEQVEAPSPLRPASSHSEKRKRRSEEPATEDSNPHKRPKSEREAHQSQMRPSRSTQPIELLGSDSEDEESENEDPDRQSQPQNIMPNYVDGRNLEGMVEANGNPLTEANLASQQAQHKAELLRGSDLPQDDEAGDSEQQDEYVEYLQNLARSSGLARTGAMNDAGQGLFSDGDVAGSGVDYPEQTMSLGLNGLEFPPLDDLPLASQEEIDAAFEDGINWPESPNHAPLPDFQSQSQSAEFEAQVVYPKLASPVLDFSTPREEVDVVLSQTKVTSQAVYPLLPRHEVAVERESSYIVVDEDEAAVTSLDEQVEDDVDLSVPEPGDGEDLIDYSAQTSESSESSEEDDYRPTAARRQKTTVETQDIVNAATQLPDLDVPLPPDSGDEEKVDFLLTTPTKLLGNKSWSEEEDRLLRRGNRKGMTASQVSKAYGIDRTSSAIRNRLALLKRHSQEKAGSESEESEGDEMVPSPSHRQLSPPNESLFVEAPVSPLPRMSPSSEHRDSSIEPPSSPELERATATQSQRNLQHTQKLDDEDVNSYVDKMTIVFGHKESSVIDALKCTSMRPELAELVLLERKAGKGLPGDIAGIWSEDEDRFLESGNARRLKALEDKHGWEELEARMQFLQEWREEEEEGSVE